MKQASNPNAIYIGTSPCGTEWWCYEPSTLETMKANFIKEWDRYGQSMKKKARRK